MNEDAGAAEKSVLEEYGPVARWNGTLGEDCLIISDPKAIHHILHGTTYLYERPAISMEFLAMVLDWGLLSVRGEVHKRQRRAMAPAFGLFEAKALHPCFTRCSNSIVDKWHEIIFNAKSEHGVVIDVQDWISRGALDAIGAGAFDYDFGAVEGTGNKFTESYTNLNFGAFGMLSKKDVFILDCFKFAPKGFATWVVGRDKSPGIVNLRENRTYGREVAAKLIEEKKQELKSGTPRRDVLSLLVKSNSALRPDWKLDDGEIISQARTILFAGHETTAKTLAFALLELAKKPHIQERLRAEVMETLGKIRARGDSDFSVDDFDSMSYLLAVVKETLRVYPVVVEIIRAPKADDLLPLSKPIIGNSGKVYRELPVPGGTVVHISPIGYNMNKDVWGPDAYEFRPERWLEMNDKPEFPVGVYGNLLTFSGGNRSCIGWRFAIIEIHTFLVTFIKNFEFSLPEDGRKVRVIRPGIVTPVVVGEERKGPQLFLKVTALRSE